MGVVGGHATAGKWFNKGALIEVSWCVTAFVFNVSCLILYVLASEEWRL